MVIAIHGKKGSGKNTIANIINKDNQFVITAFAEPIKNEIIRIFKLKNEDEYDEFKRKEFNELNVNGRRIVREIGMLMRSYDETQFIKYVDNIISKNKNVIITDLRFQNELVYLKVLKDIIFIKVKRDEDNDNHISEQEFDDKYFNYIIDNKGSLEDLEKELNSIKELKE